MPLGHVRVTILAGVVVVEDVVFVVPGCGEKPIEPIDIPPPPPGKPLAGVAVGDPRHAVVPAVEDVVCQEPPGVQTEAQGNGADGIGENPGCGVADERRHTPVALDPLEMAEVGRADRGIRLRPDAVDAGTEAGDIDPTEIPARGLQTDAHADGPWWGPPGPIPGPGGRTVEATGGRRDGGVGGVGDCEWLERSAGVTDPSARLPWPVHPTRRLGGGEVTRRARARATKKRRTEDSRWPRIGGPPGAGLGTLTGSSGGRGPRGRRRRPTGPLQSLTGSGSSVYSDVVRS